MFLSRSILSLGVAWALCFSVQAMAAEDASTSNDGITSNLSSTVEKININTASVEQLDKLKGVGASKARLIVDYRAQHGPFKSVEDLTNVKGFTSKVVANLVAKNPGILIAE